ncbi:MAG: phosphonate ABC transporter ATP-binding protein [Burkholderiaceae bacterium]
MIRMRRLSKRYGDNPVLRGIDLDVAAGEFVVVLGRSGAGKSTLLRCLNRLATADAGELQVAGLDAMRGADTRALRRRVAMIFQQHHVVPRLSVLKNVLTGRLGSSASLASVLQFFRHEDLLLAQDCLQRVGLAHKAGARTDSLSGGQMQRVGIARALAQRPQLILADEPVASLDPHSARRVLQDLRNASRELGITVLCNLHQVDYAREFGDRIVGLAQGRVLFDRRADALAEADLQALYAGQEPGHDPDDDEHQHGGLHDLQPAPPHINNAPGATLRTSESRA